MTSVLDSSATEVAEQSDTVSDDASIVATDASNRPAHGTPAGEYLWLDPHKLKRAPNRDEKPANADHDASIARFGNFVPLIVVRTDEGEYEVHDGWNRTVSLRKTDHMASCVVLPSDASKDEIEREKERIARQYNTGAHRFDQSAKDRYDAAKQMLDLGVPIKEATKLLVGMPQKQVSAVKKIAKAPSVEKAHREHKLDLFQSLRAAEEFGDDPDAIAELEAAAANGRFEHHLQRMLDLRAERAAAEQAAEEARAFEEQAKAAYDAQVADLTGRGYIVLDDTDVPADYPALVGLVTASGEPATEDDITTPGNYAVRLVPLFVAYDNDNEIITPDLIDFDTREDTSLYPVEGMYHWEDVIAKPDWVRHYYCLDLEAENLALVEPVDVEADSPVIDDDEDEDPAAAAARRAAAEEQRRLAEEQHQRAAQEAADKLRRATQLNALVRSATKVRREFIREHLFSGRKSVPDGSWELIGKVMQHPSMLTRLAAGYLVDSLGGAVPNSPQNKGQGARDNHGALRALLRTAAALEAEMQPSDREADTWRRVSSFHGEWLNYLETALDYQSAPIEKHYTGELTQDEVIAAEYGETTATNDPGEAGDVSDLTDLDTAGPQQSGSADAELAEPGHPDIELGDTEDTHGDSQANPDFTL
ncbi:MULTISPECIES: hypothetical protein [Nocardia]|uniref:Uncharacterized protein n=1 Tax=Nocardia africana TaxID=134964 RepID=A0A378X5L0_9NOCA|nr:hypothetical protein [Nocardia africana]MCC3317933.1 hypothetical protein [Nocardia africana]SUA48708.1 Uncharacterised protein [Nocardia africana]